MRTNAMPLSAGSCLRSWVNASSPPAEAPTPTMGNAAAVGAPGAGAAELSPSTPSSPVEPAESSSMSLLHSPLPPPTTPPASAADRAADMRPAPITIAGNYALWPAFVITTNRK